MTRPNGKVYRARKGWSVVTFEALDAFDKSGVMVLRLGLDDYDLALDLAVIAMANLDPEVQLQPGKFGWWRETIRNHEREWEYDSYRGVPGFWFEEVG